MPIRSLLLAVFLHSLLVFQADSLFFSSRKRDCIIKPWSVWGLCQRTPKGFFETRTRNILAPRNGGKPCPNNSPTFEERTCKVGSATSSLVRAAIGSLATIQTLSVSTSYSIHHYRGPTWSEWSAFPDASVENNPNKTSLNAKGDTCQVLKDPSSGKILAAGKCRNSRSRTTRSIKESLASYFRRVRRQVLEPNRDVLFLIDRSGSIGNENIQKMKDMAAALINLFCSTINLDYTRVGVATFSANYEPLIRFDKYVQETKKIALMDEIRALNFTSYGWTHLGEALQTARTKTLFDAAWGARPVNLYQDVKKMIFLISDGCSNGPVTPDSQAPLLKAAGIEVWVIQVGTKEDCKQKMMNLDGGDSNCFTLFFYDDWNSFSDAVTEFSSKYICGLETWSDLNDQPCS